MHILLSLYYEELSDDTIQFILLSLLPKATLNICIITVEKHVSI